ncbi:MAG TPA: serine/threonine-protein kinase [Polyangiaceae bacterium]|nr:serine/threonine-protein kinase [Polyangiaceae bacterium]
MSASEEPRSEQRLVGGRYSILEVLGEGGVAVVHRAFDTVTGGYVALKRLRQQSGFDRDRAIQLFQREFHTLSQLAHPNVVSVYDYGLHEGDPFYTMELLDGGDLLGGAPYDWRKACALARDVCSALSLIHSRRFVYRDLSPKNVRCTSNGRAKLLDFGALAPMGRSKTFVGTPAIAAPEAVQLQQLDARTDLYSLGATLYFALTGRRAYPANRLADLPELWKRSPPPPSAFVPGIPAAIDDLVLELLQIDPAMRPASAAEALDRLSGIAGLERDETAQLAARAYLSTPTLIGRDSSLERFRRRLNAALKGCGAAVLVGGVRGVGRTRFLDACALEAKLAGALVLRADADDAVQGDYGVARALASQLVEAAPELAKTKAKPKLEILQAVVPIVTGERAPPTKASPPAGVELQRALREWFSGIAEERDLCIAVDDVDRIDLPSAALIALLAREAEGRKLLVVTSVVTDAGSERSSALALLADESHAISLSALSAARSQVLLQSLFGDVPNVQLVANRLHALTGGLPRDLVQLAQMLVDNGVARYDGGAWTLPKELDGGAIPSDMAQARRARIDALSPAAKDLARAFALDRTGRFSLGECATLSGGTDLARTLEALDELVAADLLAFSNEQYLLSAMGFRDFLVESLTPSASLTLHRRLAEVYQRRPGAGLIHAACLFDAGEEERGLAVLVSSARASMAKTASDMEAYSALVQTLPSDWVAIFDRGLSLCDKFERADEAFILRTRVAGLAWNVIMDAERYFAPLLDKLHQDSGIELPRLGTAERENAVAKPSHVAPEQIKSIHAMAQTVAAGVGAAAAALSVDLVQSLPDLGPVAHLSPAFAAWETLVLGVRARLLGQSARARSIYGKQLERLSSGDGAGLQETYRITQQLGLSQSLGMIEAGMGLPACLERANFIASSPMHQVNAVRIRTLHALWQGNLTEADELKKQAELLAVERARRQSSDGGHLLFELLGYALMDDLTRVRRTLDDIELLARRAAGWKAVLHWAEAEYQRLRGNPGAALESAEAALASMDPAGHPVWAAAAGARVRALTSLGRIEEAREAGLGYLAEAERRGLGHEVNYLRMPLAVASARLGATDEAEGLADAAIEEFIELGVGGLNLGLAYETRARVAIYARSSADFERCARACADAYRISTPGPLAARYERLVREQRLATTPAGASHKSAAVPLGDFGTTAARVASRLKSSRDQEGRARAALSLLLEDSGAEEGALFGVENGSLVRWATVGESEMSDSVIATAEKYIAYQMRTQDLTLEAEEEGGSGAEWALDEEHVYRPVLLCHEANAALAITAIAVLRTRANADFRHPALTASNLSMVLSHVELV